MKNIFFSSLFLLAGLVTVQANAESNGQFTPDQVKQIEKITHDYLVKNPQVLVEASKTLQEQQMQEAQKTASSAIAKNAKDIFNNPDSPVVGNPNGDVTLVEFMDYQCAHCKEMNSIVNDLLRSDSNLRVVFKELPIFGPTSQYAAKIALAAKKQGKFMEIHDAFMKDQNPLTKDEVLKIAKGLGLNVEQLDKDATSAEFDQQIKDNYKLANELALMGTPAFVISNRNGKNSIFIPGATSKENMRDAIEQARK